MAKKTKKAAATTQEKPIKEPAVELPEVEVSANGDGAATEETTLASTEEQSVAPRRPRRASAPSLSAEAPRRGGMRQAQVAGGAATAATAAAATAATAAAAAADDETTKRRRAGKKNAPHVDAVEVDLAAEGDSAPKMKKAPAKPRGKKAAAGAIKLTGGLDEASAAEESPVEQLVAARRPRRASAPSVAAEAPRRGGKRQAQFAAGAATAAAADETTRQRRAGKKNAPHVDAVEVDLAAEGDSAPKMKKAPSKARGKKAAADAPTPTDSVADARHCFNFLLSNFDADKFFKKYWESKCLHVKFSGANFVNDLLKLDGFFDLFTEHHLNLNNSVNLAKCTDGVRSTLAGSGRAVRCAVAHLFEKEGWSIQVVSPQTYSDAIFRLCAPLQELFCSFVGANVYATPAGAQGFAPHSDDIDAFVLQLEGRKRWRVYEPRDPSESLPLLPSQNLTPEEMSARTATLDGWLAPGDVLYMPRGFVHEAHADAHSHSLHVTVSVGRQNTYADLLRKLLPDALEAEIEANVDLRHSLPPGYLQMAGVADAVDGAPPPSSAEANTFERHFAAAVKAVERRVSSLKHSGVDLMAVDFLTQALPPYLSEDERQRTVFAEGPFDAEKHTVGETSRVRLLRRSGQRYASAGVCVVGERRPFRLIFETAQCARVVHCMRNERQFGLTEHSVAIPENMQGAMAHLTAAYPQFVTVADLDCDATTVEKVAFAQLLYTDGVLLKE